jgi:hypothetical protein
MMYPYVDGWRRRYMGPRVQYSFTILGLLSVQLDLYQLKRTVTMTVIHTIIYIIMIITIYINHPVCRTAEPSCFRRRADGRSSAHETRNFLRRPCTDTTPTLAGAATPTPHPDLADRPFYYSSPLHHRLDF